MTLPSQEASQASSSSSPSSSSFSHLLNLSFFSHHRLPVLLQTEAAECGLASLAMVANYWGHHIDMAAMRRRFSVSLKGVTLKSVMTMAEGLYLQPRPLKLDMEHLSQLKLPCILHWDMNHFVVLKSVSSHHAVVHDPAVGERKLSLDDFAKHFTGVALELLPTAGFEKKVETQSVSIFALMGRVIGLKRGLGQILLLGLVLQVCALVAPFYMQWLVDEALVAGDQNLITVLGWGFILLMVIQTAIGALRSWVTTVLSTHLNFQWLGNAFAHLMKLPLPYFEKRHTGDIVSRFGSIQTIQHSLTTQFVEGIIDGVLVIATLIMMCLYSIKLALVACVAVALYALLRYVMFKPMRNVTSEQIIHAAKQQTHFMESIRGVQSVRLFGKTQERQSAWLNALADQFNAQLRLEKLSVSYHTANQFIFNIERIIVIWLAALSVLENQFSVGMLFAFISYKDQFSQRLASLIDKGFEWHMMKLHGQRVADIVMSETEQALSTQSKKAKPTGLEASLESNTRQDVMLDYVEIDAQHIVPRIEFKNISFRYSESEPYLFQNFNLLIPAGQSMAITGASGCGKTTLIKLLLGLLEPTEGEILIGEEGKALSMHALGLPNYRQLLGTVMQEDALFAGSISDNIHFFDAEPDLERAMGCAHLAAIHNEIMAMPMAYHTLVGDIGTGLSGGQKQRILLARALYKQPKILVLDEATSHLDVGNETQVNQAISAIPLTRVIVAHRPETIAMAQRTIVLQGGQIVDDRMASEGRTD